MSIPLTALGIVCSLGHNGVSLDAISNTLLHPRSVERGSEFPGRNDTQLLADEHTVVKMHGELVLDAAAAETWCQARAKRERALDIYPDDRTWFLASSASSTTPLVGNASRRRRPLHLYSSAEFATNWETFCAQFSELYCRAAVEGWRLDEGVSNFAFDEEGRLRYLDDDLYPWDHGVGLAAALGVILRQYDWITPAAAQRLGRSLRESFDRRPLLLSFTDVVADLQWQSTPASAALVSLIEALSTSTSTTSLRHRAVTARTRIALIADVHANAVALTAVLESEPMKDVAQVLVLGDTVGYGPAPTECIEILDADERVIALQGNHDHAAIDDDARAEFAKEARWAIDWTTLQLEQDHSAWLAALPDELGGSGWLAVHGSLLEPTRHRAYIYALTADDNLDALDDRGVPLLFYGHTHLPGVWARHTADTASYWVPPRDRVTLRRRGRILLNPGSVGQPRDRDPRASFAVWDAENESVEFHRVAYDIESTVSVMRHHGFPPRLMERLNQGI